MQTYKMTEVAQLREAVSHLSPPDRADLADFILNSLDETHYEIDDEEVMKRCEELNSGEVRGLTLNEFRNACGR